MNKAADEFFTLADPYAELPESADFWRALNGDEAQEIKNFLYRPDTLESVDPPKKWRVRNKRFHNVSFSKTVISQIEFTDCHFDRCLF